jgi:hypothetical protein
MRVSRRTAGRGRMHARHYQEQCPVICTIVVSTHWGGLASSAPEGESIPASADGGPLADVHREVAL